MINLILFMLIIVLLFIHNTGTVPFEDTAYNSEGLLFNKISFNSTVI